MEKRQLAAATALTAMLDCRPRLLRWTDRHCIPHAGSIGTTLPARRFLSCLLCVHPSSVHLVALLLLAVHRFSSLFPASPNTPPLLESIPCEGLTIMVFLWPRGVLHIGPAHTHEVQHHCHLTNITKLFASSNPSCSLQIDFLSLVNCTPDRVRLRAQSNVFPHWLNSFRHERLRRGAHIISIALMPRRGVLSLVNHSAQPPAR